MSQGTQKQYDIVQILRHGDYTSRLELFSFFDTLENMSALTINDISTLNTVDESGNNLLYEATTQLSLLTQIPIKGRMKLIAFLVKQGVDINNINNDGYSLFMQAVFYVGFSLTERRKLLPFLAGLGADVNAVDKEGNSALLTLCDNSEVLLSFPERFELCKILIELGADINLTNNEGKNALSCIELNSTDSEEEIKQIAELLKEHSKKEE